MGDRRIYRSVGRFNLTGGQQTIIPLPTDHYIEAVLLDLNAAIVTTGLQAGDIRDNAPADLLTKVELVPNGMEPIHSRCLAGLLAANVNDWGSAGNSCVATSDVLCTARAHVRIDVAMPRTKYPEEYLRDARQFTSLNLILQTALPAQGTVLFVTGEPTSVGAMTATVDVTMIEWVQGTMPDNAIQHKYLQPEIEIPVTAASVSLTTNLKVEALLRGLGVMAMAGAAATTLYRVDTVVNNLTLKYGGIQYVSNMRFAEAEAAFAKSKGIALQTGTAWFDFSPDGLLSQMIDMRNMGNLALELNVSVPTTIQKVLIWPQYVVAGGGKS